MSSSSYSVFEFFVHWFNLKIDIASCLVVAWWSSNVMIFWKLICAIDNRTNLYSTTDTFDMLWVKEPNDQNECISEYKHTVDCSLERYWGIVVRLEKTTIKLVKDNKCQKLTDSCSTPSPNNTEYDSFFFYLTESVASIRRFGVHYIAFSDYGNNTNVANKATSNFNTL